MRSSSFLTLPGHLILSYILAVICKLSRPWQGWTHYAIQPKAGTSIVLPVVDMDQPTGLFHIYLWRRLCEFWIFENYCTHSFPPEIWTRDPFIWKSVLFRCQGGDNVFNAKDRANEIGQSWCLADLFDFHLPTTGTSQRPPIDPMQTHVA